MRKLVATTALVATAARSAFWHSSSPAQDTTDQQLGNVHFETSCNEVAQRRFDRAMRYQHSYWYVQAREVLEETLKADPSCAIAYWGIALGLWDNQHNPPPARTTRPRWRPSRRPRRSAPRPSASATTSMRWRCSIPTMTRRPIAPA